MQYDIKYAYFNFLQSIPYTLSQDPSPCELGNGEAHFDRSSCNLGDESGTEVSRDIDEND